MNIRRELLLLIGLSPCTLLAQQPLSQPLTQTVVSQCLPTHYDEQVILQRVNDGDTLTLKDGRLVRLIGIDSPEVDFQYPDLSEPYGDEAKHFLQKRLQPGVKLKLLFDKKRLDPYGRTLAYVYTETGEHLQEVLLRKGYAKARVYQNDYFWQCLNDAELSARESRLGLWSHPDFRAKEVSELTREDHNQWREIRGVVSGYERKGQHLWLVLDEKFYFGIPNASFGKFNNILTLDLLETPVIVRGVLYFSYKKWQLIGHHPSQISLQNRP